MEREFIKDRIIQIRSSENISARALSLRLGMSSEYLNQVENGRMMPSVDFLINFCEFFNISLVDFFNRESIYVTKHNTLISKIDKLTIEQYGIIDSLLDNMIKSNKN